MVASVRHQKRCGDSGAHALVLYLADTSAWHRSGRAFDRWLELVDDLALCTPVRLELFVSARGPGDYRTVSDNLLGFRHLSMGESAERVATQTQALLAQRSQHRGPTPIDLLIAAIAEVNGATLLHYDRHFDTIARVTGQPMEWLARRGSLD